MPPAVDLAPAFEKMGLPPQAQGERPTCSLFAIAAVANYEWLRAEAGPRVRFSEEFLLWASNKATGAKADQAMFFAAVHGLNAFGICREELMPYAAQADGAGVPSPEALEEARPRGRRWNVRWLRLWDVRQPVTDEQFQAIRRTLADGHPVACGLRWPKSHRADDLLVPPSPDEVYDGHSIVLVGYADDGGRPGGGVFRFRNSRGPRWGQGGYGLMSYAYVRAYANDALWLELGPPGSEVPIQRFEAEDMEITARRGCQASRQAMKNPRGGLWSGRQQLFCRAEDGGSVELEFVAVRAGRYRVRVLATAAPDYGRVRVSLDGRATEPTFDLYSGQISPAGSLDLGTRELVAGPHKVRFDVIGRNPASTGYFFGVDAVDLLAPQR